MISHKKILFLTPYFYDYHTIIHKYLVDHGNDVIMLDNQKFSGLYYSLLSRNVVMKILRKLFPAFRRRIYEHKAAELYKLDNQEILTDCYDIVFCIRGDFFPDTLYREIKNINKDSQFILYEYDSLKHIEKKSHFRYFYRKLTFDKADAFSEKMTFLPLFYCGRIPDSYPKKDIDLLFVCSYTLERLQFLKEIISNYGSNKKIYHHIYSPMSCDEGEGYVTNQKINYKEYLDLMLRSKVAVDLVKKGQIGLTIRTIESLFTKTKLVSNNKNIKNYEFFDPVNIMILDRQNLILDEVFSADFKEYDQNVLNHFTLEKWIDTIFE